MKARLVKAMRSIFVISGAIVLGFGLTRSTEGSQAVWLGCLFGGGLLVAIGLWPKVDELSDSANRPAINVVSALAFVFGLLAIQLARVQVLSGKAISGRTGIDPVSGDTFSNIRAVNGSLTGTRGRIVDRNGEVLAESTTKNGEIGRRYPLESASYVCGYFSPLKYGLAEIERRFDDELSGRSTGSPIEREIDKVLGRAARGGTVRLTIDAGLQTLAHDLLGGRIGAVVLLETGTGAVRTLASNPHVDPNGLVAVDLESATAAADYWAELQADPAQPLLNRATQGLYTPGSTFKTITASAAIEDGVATPQTVYTDDGDLEVDGHVIVEHNRPDDSIDEWTLEQGLAFSLNVVFAQVGLELGADRLYEIAGKFGFGEEIPFDVEVATGQIASKRSFLDQPAAVADTAFGQGELLTTPLGMALVAAAIANEGEMMRPYLVDRITDVDGERMKSAEPGVWRRPIGASTARTMRDLMVNTVENGYALAAAIDGLLVGGKTGTAETGETEPHAWFIGFAGDAAPTHAVAVLLEHGGTAVSEPIAIAREMLRSAILG